jgi:hypothetical protein
MPAKKGSGLALVEATMQRHGMLRWLRVYAYNLLVRTLRGLHVSEPLLVTGHVTDEIHARTQHRAELDAAEVIASLVVNGYVGVHVVRTEGGGRPITDSDRIHVGRVRLLVEETLGKPASLAEWSDGEGRWYLALSVTPD